MKRLLQRWNRQRKLRKLKSQSSRLWRWARWGVRVALLLLVVDVVYLMTIWPDWNEYKSGKPPKSRFISDYEAKIDNSRLSWRPVSINTMPRHLRRAVIAAEDARFYHHNGFDVIAFKEAMDTNLELMEFKYGASTISQQTVKNLFFTSSRTPLRKWHELVFTLGMEWNLKKRRILETYLNIAEFGKGVYGVEAASWHYFGKSVYSINQREAAQLAACLPSPVKHNPDTQTKRFVKRSNRIYRWIQTQNVEKKVAKKGSRRYSRFSPASKYPRRGH